MLKKCIRDLVSILLVEGLEVNENLFEEVSFKMFYRQVKILRNKKIAFINILWRNHLVESAIWEVEAVMKSHVPYLLFILLDDINVCILF